MAPILKYILFTIAIYLFFTLLLTSNDNDLKLIENEILKEVTKNTDTLYIVLNRQQEDKDYYSKEHLSKLKTFINDTLNAHAIITIDISQYKFDYINFNPTQFYVHISNYFFIKSCNFDIIQGDGSIAYNKTFFWFFKWYEISRNVTSVS